MTVRQRRRLLLTIVCATCALAPAARAVGPPMPSYASGKLGAVAPGGKERLLTRRAGVDTMVFAVHRGDRRVLRSRTIGGRWTIPAVALDGGTTGLSADGRTLVLARPVRSSPPTSARLSVLDARALVVRRQIALRGFFTVDAISPDGRWLYLVQYAGEDFLDYRVRALDTRTGGLVARDVVDPREPDEQMGGLPLTRAMSRDGRWAYTLYSGGDETFIHALDTVGRTAACIDLDMIPPGGDLAGFRLEVSADGGEIRVRREGRAIAIVDARTFTVREPGEPAPARSAPAAEPRRASAPEEHDGGFPWPPFTAIAALAGLGTAAVAIAHRRHRPPFGRGEPTAR
jgi:hypothetical protein